MYNPICLNSLFNMQLSRNISFAISASGYRLTYLTSRSLSHDSAHLNFYGSTEIKVANEFDIKSQSFGIFLDLSEVLDSLKHNMQYSY